ncbi:MAG: hypothetical protein IT436_04100 [Phycisphaerales bacterium]|nr:hypothetical protein [Phycisphaerales bacterium]
MRCATLASAAATGLLFAQIVHADIVYTLPPQPIVATAAMPGTTPGMHHDAAPLDFDNDGAPELTINAFYSVTGGWFGGERSTYLELGGFGVSVRYEAAEEFIPLQAGTLISASDYFAGELQHRFAVDTGLGSWGRWVYGAPHAFFGIRFDIIGQTHLGWARAQINFHSEPVPRYSVTVFDYAYESVPGAPVVAGAIPAPGAVAVLELGVLCVIPRRRRPW